MTGSSRPSVVWRSHRRAVWLSVGAFLLAGAGVAFGYWTVASVSDGGGDAMAQAASLSAPTTPVATPNGGTAVTVGWTLPASQVPGAAYQVIRTSPTVSTVCTVALAATSCQDVDLTSGASYTYSVVAVLDGWQSAAATAGATTLAVTTSSLPSGEVSVAYSLTPVAAGGSGSYTSWALAGTLPGGLVFDTNTGVISGTPTAAGTTLGLVLTVTDSDNGTMSSGPLSLTIDSGPSVTTTTLAGATAGQTQYSQTLASTGGTGAITWSLTSGSLPASLLLDPSSGVISGTVTLGSSGHTFTVVATDAHGVGSPGRSLTVTVNAAPTVTTVSLPQATETQPDYSDELTASAGTAPLTWSISSGSLPSGLSLAANTGLISGAVGSSAVTHAFTVLATDANGVASIARSLTIVVNAAPTATSTDLVSATDTEVSYSQTLESSDGTGTITWSIPLGMLPGGLSLEAGSGTISGTVGIGAVTETFTVVATDANGVASPGDSLTITVNPIPTVTTTALDVATDGQPGYSQALSVSGGTTPMTWTVSSGSLPTGLFLPPGGLISGTVDANATSSTFTVVATDANEVASSGQSLTILVNAAPSVTTTSLATATDTQVGYSQTLTSSDGTGPVAWTISSGALPGGLALTPDTGVISGTVDAGASTQTFTVVATDANEVPSSDTSLTIAVNAAPSVTTTSLATAKESQIGYSQTLTSIGGTTPITWSISFGSLPTGLILTPGSGLISGTVGLNATTRTFTVVGTDSNGVASVGVSLTLTVTGPGVSAFTSAGPGNSASTGIPEPGDTVVITFSKAVLPSSICSLWTANGAQTLGTNGSANASVVLAQSGGGHDTMAVVDPTDCSGGIKIFNGALLDLGTSGYVLGGGAGTASFADGPCTVADQCTNVTLNSTDTILTITFGGNETGSGTTGTAIANPGVTYTPDPSITGTSGAGVGGTGSDLKSLFF